MYVLSKNKKSINVFHLKIIIFTAVKNCSILHGRVCVMLRNNAEPDQTSRSDLGQHCLITRYSNMGYRRYEQVTASTNNQTNMAFIS